MTIDRATLYRSAALAIALQWGVRAIGLVSVVALARLLRPEDFGVVAIALSAAAFVELFGWIGLRQALLRVSDPDRSHYDTAWTIQLILFSILAVAMIGMAPLAARFYGNPAVTGILCAMSLRMVALAVSNIGIVEFERHMTFGRDMAMRLGVRISSLAVSLIAAVILRNYWALVIGMLAQSIFWAIGTYVAHPYRPRLSLARRAEILGVSLWMFVSTFSEWIQSQVERLVLGRFAPTATIGLYSVSKDLSNIFTQEIATALNRVTFVTVARGEARDGAGVATVIGAYAAIVAPLAAGLVATAPDTIAVLLGAKWLPAAPLMRIIALYTGVQAVSLMVVSVLQASDQARRAASLNIAGALLSALGIGFAGWQFRTPEAVAIAALTVNSLMLATGIAILAVNAKASMLGLASNLLRPILAASAMTFVLMRLLAVETGSPFVDLTIQVVIGIVAYAAALSLLWFASGRPAGAEREAAQLIGSLKGRLAFGR
jgi:O-antigen/teichoic acid export membrane protein